MIASGRCGRKDLGRTGFKSEAAHAESMNSPEISGYTTRTTTGSKGYRRAKATVTFLNHWSSDELMYLDFTKSSSLIIKSRGKGA